MDSAPPSLYSSHCEFTLCPLTPSPQSNSSQFKAGNLKSRFKPYSKFPPCYKVGGGLRCVVHPLLPGDKVGRLTNRHCL